jgi:hypothetical protein
MSEKILNLAVVNQLLMSLQYASPEEADEAIRQYKSQRSKKKVSDRMREKWAKLKAMEQGQ